MIIELKESLKNYSFNLNFGELTDNEPKLIKTLLFIKNFVTQLEKLYMTAMFYSSSSFMEKIVQTLSSSNIKVSFTCSSVMLHSILGFNNIIKMLCTKNSFFNNVMSLFKMYLLKVFQHLFSCP